VSGKRAKRNGTVEIQLLQETGDWVTIPILQVGSSCHLGLIVCMYVNPKLRHPRDNNMRVPPGFRSWAQRHTSEPGEFRDSVPYPPHLLPADASFITFGLWVRDKFDRRFDRLSPTSEGACRMKHRNACLWQTFLNLGGLREPGKNTACSHSPWSFEHGYKHRWQPTQVVNDRQYKGPRMCWHRMKALLGKGGAGSSRTKEKPLRGQVETLLRFLILGVVTPFLSQV